MPFAEYSSFEDCVAQNQDKGDPEAYCADIQRSVEGKSADGILLTREEVRKLCPSCADKMVAKGIVAIRVPAEFGKRSPPKPQFQIAKTDPDRQLVFGWASVSTRPDGVVVLDKQGDMVAPEVLEDAAYDFVLHSREGDEMHTEMVKARLVESFVTTPDKLAKMGVPDGVLPVGWWVGFHVDDAAVFAKVKRGEYPMFSIGGSGVREAA